MERYCVLSFGLKSLEKLLTKHISNNSGEQNQHKRKLTGKFGNSQKKINSEEVIANEDISSKELETAAGFKSSEITKIMIEEPHRLETYDYDGNSEVWSQFKLLKMDGDEIPFAKCLVMGNIRQEEKEENCLMLKKKMTQLNESGTNPPSK